jgi:hypothetical protein
MEESDWYYDDYDDMVDTSVIPEFDLERDNAKQIADAMLSAVLDGKQLYGAFEPACCETTVKVQNMPDIPSKSRLTYMSVNFSPENAEWDPEISDLPYEHWSTTSGIFSGTETTENLFVPFKAEDLGGVYNKMVYTAGELKAMDILAGGTGEYVEELVEDLYGLDDVNLDAVMPITSENYSGRAMAAETKSHHEIYGVQTDLARVKVNFDNYNRDSFPYESAIDWSRILVSLKYLGVSNLLYDQKRRAILAHLDYTMYAAPPINSWPILPKSSFIIPKIKLPRELAITTMGKLFEASLTIFSSVDLYQLIMDRLETVKEFSLKYSDMASDLYNAALRMLVDKIERVKRAKTFKLIDYGELASGATVLRSEDEIYKAYRENKKLSPREIFIDVTRDKIVRLVKKDPNFAKNLFDYYEKVNNTSLWMLNFTQSELDEVYQMFKLVTTEPYVSKMIALWNAIQPDYNKAVLGITKYLSKFVQAPINLGVEWPMSAGKKFVNEQPVVIIKILMKCRNEPLRDLAKEKAIVTSYEPKKMVESLHNQAQRHLRKIADAWADRYAMQYERFKAKEQNNVNTIKYQILTTAFKDLTYVMIMDTNGKFILNGTNPVMMKIYSNYCRKRNMKQIRVNDATSLMDEGFKYDKSLPEPATLSFETMGREISDRYQMIRQDIVDFISGQEWRDREIPDKFDEIYAESFVKKKVEEAPPLKQMSFMEMLAARARQASGTSNTLDDMFTVKRDYKAEAKATFEDDNEAEDYAKILGYNTWENWYSLEGRQAKKSPENVDKYFQLITKKNLERLQEESNLAKADDYDLTN